VILIGIVACILLVLYSYFVADTVVTRINDAQMTKVDGMFMIATGVPTFCELRLPNTGLKFNSGTIQNDRHQTQGQDGKDQEIRMENSDIF